MSGEGYCLISAADRVHNLHRRLKSGAISRYTCCLPQQTKPCLFIGFKHILEFCSIVSIIVLLESQDKLLVLTQTQMGNIAVDFLVTPFLVYSTLLSAAAIPISSLLLLACVVVSAALMNSTVLCKAPGMQGRSKHAPCRSGPPTERPCPGAGC